MKLREYMDRGALVPEELVIDVLVKNMKGKSDVDQGLLKKLIIDGFPRNLNQGLIYENKFRELYMILLFDVQKEVLFERMNRRGTFSLKHKQPILQPIS